MSSFEKSYQQLNKPQQQAVDTIDGPVLVIAGPGTGKTQLLSMRVANILRQTDTDASNILCLTFTNKAATNMRARLIELTGAEADHVKIKTFHSFTAEVMNKYPEYFWNGAQLTSAPDVVQKQIIQDILSTLPLDNPFATKFYGTYTMANRALESIGLAKEAGLTPEKLRSITEANLAHIEIIEPEIIEIFSKTLSNKSLPDIAEALQALPKQGTEQFTSPISSINEAIYSSAMVAINKDLETTKASNTSKWKSNWITKEQGQKGIYKERRRNEWWLALSEIYQKYRDILHGNGYYDYSDMLLEVITQIEQQEPLRAEIQEQYHYLLIDEFQDSNAAQLRLCHLVADHPSANGKPNIMAVGDDDQSIYAFNGAEIDNLLHFNRTYGSESVTSIVLKDNYRSTQEVLDASDQIIKHCSDRLITRLPGLDKTLTSHTEPSINSKIKHTQYHDIDQQLFAVSQEIGQLLRDKPNETIAVLARNKKSLRSIATSLTNMGVPMRYEEQTNILKNNVVILIIDICQIVLTLQSGNQSTLNAEICNILRHPVFDIPAIELWEIAKANRYDADWLQSILDRESTRGIGEWFLWLSGQAAYQPLGIMLEQILGLGEEAPQRYIRDYLYRDEPLTSDYLQTLLAVRQLRKLVAEFKPQTEPKLSDLLSYIDAKITANEAIYDSEYFESYSQRGVDVMTVHKAKGLEFDTVYIIDCVLSNWEPSRSSHKPPVNLPLARPLESHDDYARLMYVAATRAKQNLFFTSYSGTTEDDAAILPTPLISHIPSTTAPALDTEQSVTVLEQTLSWPRLKYQTEKQILSGVLNSFSINVTNLINFLDVAGGGPASFLERSLLRLPDVKTMNMVHGTAMHSALEFAQINLNKTGKQPSLDAIQEAYSKSLDREYIARDDKDKYTEHGLKILDKLFNYHKYRLTAGSRPEFMVSDVFIGEARVGGKFDRIDFLSKTSIRIADYKTGKALSSFTSTDQTKQIQIWKHKLQLVFYALLAQHHPELSRFPDVDGQMIYLESKGSDKIELNYTPTPEDMERLATIIESVWQHVQNYDLPDTSSYPPTIAGIRAFEEYLIKSKDA